MIKGLKIKSFYNFNDTDTKINKLYLNRKKKMNTCNKE